MDIEFALLERRLYLLQARPITTHVPLPPAMLTAPGESRLLYLDVTISVQGLLKPVSVLGTSVLAQLLKKATRRIFSRDLTADPKRALPVALAGRIYFNLSTVFALMGQDRFAGLFEQMDPYVTETLRSLPQELYRSPYPEVKGLPWRAAWKLPEKLTHVLAARLMPEQALAHCRQTIEAHLRRIDAILSEPLSLEEVARQLLEATMELIWVHTIPLFVTARVAQSKLRRLGAEVGEERELDALVRSLPHNQTVEMGLALCVLAEHLPAELTLEGLVGALEERTLPAAFLQEWDAFLERFGHRGPEELDIRSPRFRDRPELLLGQLLQLQPVVGTPQDPRRLFERGQEERRQAFSALSERVAARSWFQGKRFNSLYRVMENLGGLRETHKFYLIYALDKLRTRVLERGRQLVEAGRLEQVEQVFDLTLEQLSADLVDLAACIAANRALPDQLARISSLPRLIDSRGLMLRPPPRPAKPGETLGTAISAGVVRGPIKVLHSPDEKPVEVGDILVARATDPGWTPLFVNAAAVVLEVGGMLQHGALVAREYGKPCVAGVEGATERWSDGTLVEVDGTQGVIRLVED